MKLCIVVNPKTKKQVKDIVSFIIKHKAIVSDYVLEVGDKNNGATI